MNNVTNQPQTQQTEGFHPSTPAAHQKAVVESEGKQQARTQLESIVVIVEELDGDNADIAYEAIQNDPLSVQVRSGWHVPGQQAEPEEFEILLCWGGPAVRIVGKLDTYKQPINAHIEYQDWGTPWTELRDTGGNSDAILTYCQQFYFG